MRTFFKRKMAEAYPKYSKEYEKEKFNKFISQEKSETEKICKAFEEKFGDIEISEKNSKTVYEFDDENHIYRAAITVYKGQEN